MRYWLCRGSWDEIIVTEDGRVTLCVPFREPADLIRSVRDWAEGGPGPADWDGDYFEQLVAEGYTPDDIEAARVEIDEFRRRYYEPAGETAQEVMGWLQETAPHLFR